MEFLTPIQPVGLTADPTGGTWDHVEGYETSEWDDVQGLWNNVETQWFRIETEAHNPWSAIEGPWAEVGDRDRQPGTIFFDTVRRELRIHDDRGWVGVSGSADRTYAA